MTNFRANLPWIPVVRNDAGEWCYENDNDALVPIKSCVCGIAYAPHCPVDEHKRRSKLEEKEALVLAGHIPSSRDKYLIRDEQRRKRLP